MNHIFRAVVAVFTLTLVSACSTYTGDNLLRLPKQSNTHNQERIILEAKDGASKILDGLGVSEEMKKSLGEISPKSIIRDNEPLELNNIDKQLVMAGAGANIDFATNSIIISIGTLHIAHSNNNVVVSGGNVEISHDGSSGGGSLIISKGKTKISHTQNSLIYAIKGVEISHARNVRAFNTRERKTSRGYINNIFVKPLFREETEPNKSLQPTGSSDG